MGALELALAVLVIMLFLASELVFRWFVCSSLQKATAQPLGE